MKFLCLYLGTVTKSILNEFLRSNFYLSDPKVPVNPYIFYPYLLK